MSAPSGARFPDTTRNAPAASTGSDMSRTTPRGSAAPTCVAFTVSPLASTTSGRSRSPSTLNNVGKPPAASRSSISARPGGLDIDQDRCRARDPIEIPESDVVTESSRHRGEVDHRVRRAADRAKDDERVGDCVRAHLGRGRETLAYELDTPFAHSAGDIHVARIPGWNRSRTRPSKTERLGDRPHRRRGAHRVAGALSEGEHAFQLGPALVGELAGTALIPESPKIRSGPDTAAFEYGDRSWP